MKKLFPVLLALAFLITSCQIGGSGAAEPTPIPIATGYPTPTAIPLNPTVAPSGDKPAAGTERVSPVDGMIQVYAPEGSFYMGGVDPAAALDEEPDHKVTMHSFWMDKVEVTNAMYKLCAAAGACEPLRTTKSQTRMMYYNDPQYADYPAVYATWNEATAYCKWAGRHLPTEAEWERAGRGDDFRIYPWGDEPPDSSRANFNFQVGDTTRVGSYAAGASPYGALDMAGNVAEWVNDFYDPVYYNKLVNFNPMGPTARANYYARVVRGGTFQDAGRDIRVSDRSQVLGPDPNALIGSPQYYGDYSPKIGFRCVSDN